MHIASFDSETTGLDIWHGVKSFFVTTCEPNGVQTFWEWDVDPLTRDITPPPDDLEEVADYLNRLDRVVLQNAKYDAAVMAQLAPTFQWPWHKTHDTLISGHLLSSNTPHDLTSQGIQWLGVNVQHYEDALKKACTKAQTLARKHLPNWLVARKGLGCMPSAKEKVWKFDGWLPRQICLYADGQLRQHGPVPKEWWMPYCHPNHPWRTVLRDYGNSDSALTLALHQVHEELLHHRKLWRIYEERLKVLRVANLMEDFGITASEERLKEREELFKGESDHYGRVCTNIAKTYDYDLKLPKGANNASLTTFAFDVLKLPAVKTSKKTGKPALDKQVLEMYESALAGDPRHSKQLMFIRSLRSKRKRDTSLSYMASYRKFWLPWRPITLDSVPGGDRQTRNTITGGWALRNNLAHWHVLHPNLNPTGTDTLRWSSNNPNEQNISKQVETCRVCMGKGCDTCHGEGEVSYNLRYIFGPAPGREWWSMDAKNIELRIPTYAANEVEMKALFEAPDEPPYYGSNHLLNFHTVYPELWDAALKEVGFDKVGPYCKKRYASTNYQWCKNGGFAVQYGAIERENGTADRAFHRLGAHTLLKQRFTAIHGPGGLNERCIQFAERHGYVETMPDKTVDPERGYPLICERTDSGGILPTVPLNYNVQGTAMWWMMMSMVKCQAYLDDFNRRRDKSQWGYIVMQVHDELVFDFPRKENKANLGIIRDLRDLMSSSGDGIGIPTPVGVEYHGHDWSTGETCD